MIGKNIKIVESKLNETNPKKFQYMILGKRIRQSIILNTNNIEIRESSSIFIGPHN